MFASVNILNTTAEESGGPFPCLGRTEMDAAMAGRTERIFPADGSEAQAAELRFESPL